VLTNCEEIELRYGDSQVKRVAPDRERYPHLPYAPVIVDRRHYIKDELGLWGMSWEDVTIIGLIGGKVVATQRLVANPIAYALEVVPDATRVGAHEAVRVMVRALDQADNKLPFFREPVSITVSGAGWRIGPGFVPLRAGSTGFWVQASGPGEIAVTVHSDRLGSKVVQLWAETRGNRISEVLLKGLRKACGAAVVIKGVDLTVEPGEFCVFVGPSGCGKSTLLRMIAVPEEISRGDLMIGGVRVNDVDASQRGIAMVFQSFALHPI